MSRKDYETVAAVLHDSYSFARTMGESVVSVTDVALGLAVAFQKDNPRFDTERFMKAVTG